MKSFRTNLVFVALTTILAISSCKKTEDSIKGTFTNGIFIVNEGAFQTGTGTITFYNPDSNLVKQNIFESINGRPLGNIAQSMAIYNDKAYIVVNNAGKVEVVDPSTFKTLGTITGLVNPSQFLFVENNKAYISDWVGRVAIVDLATNKVKDTIRMGTGPDMMVKTDKYVFVANSGGLGLDSTVSVVEYSIDQVVKTIKVGNAPSGMAVDGIGKIWVLCKGKGFSGWSQAGDTPGKLVRIDPVTMAIDFSFTFTSTGDHPEKLVINKEKTILYFLFNSGIYRFNTLASNPLPEKLVSRYFYGLGYENKTGYLYASDPKDYQNAGVVLRFRADNGSLVDSIQAGIIPRGFAFTE